MGGRGDALPAERPAGSGGGVREASAKLLDKAARVLEAAKRERDLENLDLAAGHAYYAMFYVAEALLLERDLTFSKHGAVHGAYGKEFAKTGDLDPKFHRWLLEAFRQRITAHYEVDPDITEDAVNTLIRHGEEFLSEGRAYLEGRG